MDASWVAYASRVAKSSADGQDELEGRSQPDEPDYQILVRRLWPFGVRSMPPAGVDAVAVFAGAAQSAGVMVGAESPQYGPSDLLDGEVAFYNKTTGVLIKLHADGKVTIDAPTGSDVVINGGTAKVARAGDAVDKATGSMTTWISAVSTALGLTPPTNFGTVAGGAERFKA